MSKRLVFLFAVALLAFLAIEAWRFSQAYSRMQDGRTQLQAVLSLVRDKSIDIEANDLDLASQDLKLARDNFESAARILGQDPLIRVSMHIPWLGSQGEAAMRLARIGRDGSILGEESLSAIRDAQRIRDSKSGSLTEKVVPLIDALAPHMEKIKARFSALDRERARINDEELVGPISEAVKSLDEHIELLRAKVKDYDHTQQLAPGLLGYDQPRTYLILTQDNTELFPTGGLISVYGLVTFDKGRMSRLAFTDVGRLWETWQKTKPPYVQPPGPLQRYLLRDWSWNLGTSNWSPDFPTAAKQAEYFLEIEGGGRVDGVIAINFIVVEELLKTLGPLPMSDYGVTLRAEASTEVILEQTHTPRAQAEGKYTFVAKVADQMVNRVLIADSSQWLSLARTFERLVHEKQVFVYLNDPAKEDLVRQLGWSGEVRDEPGDYLMLVDTSVHSTKLNLVLEQSIDVAIRLDTQGNAWHRVKVHYRNGFLEWAKGKSSFLLSQMAGGLYGSYLRLFVPQQSLFQRFEFNGKSAALEDVGVDAGKGALGSYFALPAGDRATLSFDYMTPGITKSDGSDVEYRLVLQKQSGTKAIPLKVTMFVPAGAQITGLTLDGHVLPTNVLIIGTDLLTDREIVLKFYLT